MTDHSGTQLTGSLSGQGVFVIDQDQTLVLAAGQLLSFDLASGGHWYGHGFAHRQPYPLETEAVVNDAFAVNNTQSPVWMCSAGVVILVETTARLEVRLNENSSGRLDLCAPEQAVTVRFFHARSLPEAHGKFLRHIGWPNPAPASAFLGDAIFCTWTQYPRCITQERVLGMAREIRRQEYPCSTLTIDDRWESCFGELQFARDFPDPAGLMRNLHELGFRVLLWVTPFVNREAANFNDLAERRILVPARDGSGAALLKWWGGTAGLVDLTNPAGKTWFRERLLFLKNQIGVDGFKIDGGDAKYQPPLATAAWHDYRGPSGYSDALLELFEEIAPGMCETRTVWLSARRNILWREGGKDSHWNVDNGLTAMVHLGLHMSLLGYDISIPDMVPGRVQTMVSTMDLPSDELMVRWTEASALFPILQFSYFPWNYGPATAAVVLGLARLHKALEHYLTEQCGKRTIPLLRSLWYDWPENPDYYRIGDQFLLGPDLLAAPVLVAGCASRNVVLPPGQWQDAWSGKILAGGRTLADWPAPCPGIPLFVRAGNAALFRELNAVLATIPRGSIPPGLTTTTYQAGLDRDLKVTG